MEVTPTQSTQAAPAPPAAPPTPASSALASDFDTFIQMMTTQAKYQDPLDPIDSSEYASQLAQFSMVEQQVLTNETLNVMVQQLGATNLTALAEWVGMEARAVTPMTYDGTPITVSPNPVAIADTAFLVVTDSTGTEVQRTAIPVSANPIEWTGLDDDGAPLDEGTYWFTVESHSNGELLLAEPAEVYARVTEAQSIGGEVILILEGGSAISSASVSAIRQAES